MWPVVLVGSINIDFVAQAERLPCAGEAVPGLRSETHSGGKGANQAYAVAKLGHPVSLIGVISEDLLPAAYTAN